MQTIATYWYVWLAVMVLGYGYATAIQYRTTSDTFFNGSGATIVASVVGALGLGLLLLAFLVHLIDYAR
ncbi:MAG TPA: hypothetical protein PKA42_00125 [Candidatus Paceibacterota bacterium]|nr:hypothetical protein [Candidatus Paceibacterota bacterium]HMO82553.1 hypothetical protein [Candidatus Paceibacterota bacterium]